MTPPLKRLKKDEFPEVVSTRTLFISKISSKEENTKIKEYLQSTGNVHEIYSLNDSLYEVIFVIFYDIMTSEEVYNQLTKEGKEVLYTISKYEIPRNGEKCDETKNQGTILIMGRDLTEILTEDEVAELTEPFGKVRWIRDFKPFQKFVEYDDTRNALKAFKEINDMKYKTGSLAVKLSWDIPVNTRWEMIKEIDSALKQITTLKEEPEQKKEIKEEKISKIYEKSVFLKALDDFIVENISHIEKWF